ncbi:MAG: hypothetical protein H0U89_08545 [Acidimicrobiia bacterium]|nr:hypothetical protein [Acidimicrobiia bacterium]
MAEPEDDADDEVRDSLPEDLDASGFVGPYRFPDNSRRRIPGAIYLAVAAGCLALWLVRGEDGVMVNEGLAWVALALGAFGVFCYVAGRHLGADETEALVAATRTVGFPVGHASAQLGWRGLASRPTWRILLYSSEEPPRQRGLVLVDGVDGEVLQHFVEENPEQDWPGSEG